MANKNRISDELLAAYLEGNTTKAETLKVLEALKTDKSLRETLDIALSIDDDSLESYDVLPMMELAAENSKYICSVLCEAFILHRRDVEFEEKDLLDLATKNQWLKPHGSPLHSIGQLMAHYGLMITHKYNAGIEDIKYALSIDNDVIVAVDSDKLYPGREDKEDAPNHAVVVLGVGDKEVKLFDPSEHETNVTISLKDFLKAWKESRNYMVRVLQSIDDYVPQPINLDDIHLTDDLWELQEAIAENTHEAWVEARIKDGWTYGTVRDDINKKDPELIPYSALPDSEKECDRLMALDTIRLVKKLGFNITRD